MRLVDLIPTANINDMSDQDSPQSTLYPTPSERQAKAIESIARLLRLTIILVLTASLLWLLADIVLLIFASLLIAVLLRGAASAIVARFKIPPGIALFLFVFAIIGTLGVFFAWLGPQFGNEFVQLLGIIRSFDHSGAWNNSVWGNLFHRVQTAANALPDNLFGPSTTSIVMSTLGGMGSLLLISVTGLYLAATPKIYEDGAVRLIPIRHRDRAREIMAEITSVLRWWMLGQMIDMIVVAILASTGLYLLGLPMAFALGGLAGLMTFVPYIGAFVAAVPALVVAGTLGVPAVLWVVVIYLACHAVEGYVVSPLITRKTVYLPPALTVFSMAILGTIYGVFGIVIATPITAAGLVLVREIYVADMLHDYDRTGFVAMIRARLSPLRTRPPSQPV
ncbi:AI-2E family transporter [Acidiphilium sp.]|uniref:AI-2E family transporter n=1 Tax=Acidiphilium sp. TaxID=527 RepID=UPI003D02A380